MWKQTRVVDERARFLAAVPLGETSFSELCVQYGVSRKTGYKWLAREAEGEPLDDRSRRPHTSPQRLDEELEDLFLELRRARPTWGPRKLVARLRELHGRTYEWPAASTVGELLKRNGLVRARRVRMKIDPYISPLSPMDTPNAVWCADFKGDFRTGDRRRVLPFTLTDGASRYLLRCRAVPRGDREQVVPIFESAFREHGLPNTIRTDNGPPFVSTGPGGLSKLSIWFFKLGIHHERTKPGKPTQNGRHERMHRTLAEDTASPPASTLAKQQRRFDVFCQVFNEERPHEALDMKTPSDVYRDSARAFPRKIDEVAYPDEYARRVVRNDGTISLDGHHVFVSEVLTKEVVGLEKRDDDTIALYFGSRRLGAIDCKTMKFDKTLLDD
jgi:transposase InsO family protein